MDLALHEPSRPFFLEKWYLDVLLDDGTVLLVYLGWMRLAGLTWARVTAELFPAQGAAIRGQAKVDRIEGGEDTLRFGPVSIRGDRIAWQTLGLSGELLVTPRAPVTSLREPFFAAPSGTLNWRVEVPDADASGRVWWPGGERKVTGRSYRDRVWFDIVPWKFPIRELAWGRAVAGPHATTWVNASTEAGEIRAAWFDGRHYDDLAGRVKLEPGRAFLETRVADLPGLLLGPARPLLRRLTRDPHEVKYVAPARLDDVPGLAVHERVVWR